MSSQSLKLNQKKKIPEGWIESFFENYFDIFSGIGFKKSEYSRYGIKLLRIDNVSYGVITWESEACLPIQYLKKFPKIVLDEGDVLLALNRPITNGKLKIAILEKKDTPSILYQRVGKIVFLNSNDDKKFLFYVLQKHIKKFVEETSVGTDQPFISTTKLKKLKLLLPANSKEQFLIGKTLSENDELIKQLDYLITKRKNIKQGIIQDLLTGKRRLPGFTKDWNTFSFNDVFDITAGGDLDKEFFSKSKDDKHPFPIYSNSLTNNGLYGFSSKFQYDENSITITARGTVGKANARFHKYSAIGRILVLKPTIILDCFVVAEYINNRIRFSIESTGVPQLTAPQMSKYSIILPEPDEQSAIAKILSDMNSEIQVLEIKRDKYIMIKNGIMQKLLTGEIRLT